VKYNASRKNFLLLQKIFGFLYADGIPSSNKPAPIGAGIKEDLIKAIYMKRRHLLLNQKYLVVQMAKKKKARK
jgi:hypothetical protein